MTHLITRIGLTLATTALISACTPQEPDSSSASSSSSPEHPLAAEGEFCGGIAGIACAEGLRCQYDGTYPDAGGTCVR